MDSATKSPTPRTPLVLVLALTLAAVTVLGLVPSAGAAPVQAKPATTAQKVSSAKAAPVVVRGCGTAKTLGYYYGDATLRVYACGARPSFDGAKTGSGPTVLPFAGSRFYYRGYQCIELVARYLKARYNADPGKANGSQAVDRYAAAYPAKFVKIANGTRNQAPRKGDVLSLSTTARFNDVGHTGVVISSSVNGAGNGTILAAEQNWGGAGGTKGYHSYTVRAWRVQLAGLPYVKWLRAR